MLDSETLSLRIWTRSGLDCFEWPSLWCSSAPLCTFLHWQLPRPDRYSPRTWPTRFLYGLYAYRRHSRRKKQDQFQSLVWCLQLYRGGRRAHHRRTYNGNVRNPRTKCIFDPAYSAYGRHGRGQLISNQAKPPFGTFMWRNTECAQS